MHPPILRDYKELKNRAHSGRTVPKIVRPTAGLCAPGAECTLNFEHCKTICVCMGGGGSYHCHFPVNVLIYAFVRLSQCQVYRLISYPLPHKQKLEGGGGILRPPDWPQFWPPAGQETNIF